MCNSRIKFGMFYRYVGQYFHKVATGHYAQAVTVGDVTSLVMSPDSVKDQTYFLANLNQNQLNKGSSLTHSLSHSLTHLLTHSLTYSLTFSLTRSHISDWSFTEASSARVGS